MKTVELQEIGEIIRKIRKQRGLRLEDLADNNISPATISNIERGVPHVSMDKALYLLDKLKIETSQIPFLLMEEENELRNVELELEMVESLWKLKQYDKAMDKIEHLNLEDNHPLAATAAYLKGKCFVKRGTSNGQSGLITMRSNLQISILPTMIKTLKPPAFVSWAFVHTCKMIWRARYSSLTAPGEHLRIMGIGSMFDL